MDLISKQLVRFSKKLSVFVGKKKFYFSPIILRCSSQHTLTRPSDQQYRPPVRTDGNVHSHPSAQLDRLKDVRSVRELGPDPWEPWFRPILRLFRKWASSRSRLRCMTAIVRKRPRRPRGSARTSMHREKVLELFSRLCRHRSGVDELRQ